MIGAQPENDPEIAAHVFDNVFTERRPAAVDPHARRCALIVIERSR